MMKPFLFLIFNNPLIHPMPHRTWIALIGWFIDRLISWPIARPIDCPISCLLGCPPGWLTGVGGAVGRGDEGDEVDEDVEVDDPSDCTTGRSWFFGEGGLNGGCPTWGPSDGLTEGPSDGSTWGPSGGPTGGPSDGPNAGPSGGPSGCSKFSVVGTCSELPMVGGCSEFSMMGDDCLSTDWFSDCPPDCPSDWPPGCPSGWPPDCSSSWLCGGGRGGMSDEMGGRLYDGMGGNRLYNCLLNTDGNSGDWKNFGNRGEVDCRSVDWFSDGSGERTERGGTGDEGLRPKFVFRRISMLMKMKFS
jgi:hypothetical protein